MTASVLAGPTVGQDHYRGTDADTMAKKPSFQFYPGDWMKDPNLRRCSPAARGVWMDLLCLIFEAEHRGVASTGGVAWTDQEIAESITGDTSSVLAAIQELLDKRVARRNRVGAIYSRRLRRDDELRQKKVRAGEARTTTERSKTSASAANTRNNGNSKTRAGPKQKRGSSSSSSTSVKKNPPLPPHFDNDTFREAWRRWVCYRDGLRAPFTEVAVEQQIRKLSKWTCHKAVASIEQSLERGWQGLFEPHDYNPRDEDWEALDRRLKGGVA